VSTARVAAPGPAPLAWSALALTVCLVTAWATLASPQLGCAVALVTLVAGAAVRSLAAGAGAAWLVWLVAPLLRRLFSLESGVLAADPLALAPFVATLAVALVALWRHGAPPARDRAIPLAALAGFALGLPVGFGVSPEAAAYAAFAALAAVAAFMIGYRDPLVDDGTLARALRLGAPALALYGIYQYFALPAWDRAWVRETSFVTALAPEADRVRVWSTLNSPGTFAMLLGLALVAFLVSRRFTVASLLGVAAIVVALALTYIRSAWIAVAAAAVVLVFASRGRLGPRVAVALAIASIGIPALGAGTPTGQAVIGRFDTLGKLQTDTSAQERRQTATSLFPQALIQPLGAGLGSAGEASRLSGSGGFRYTDNGYLAILYQVGPLGALLVLGAGAVAYRRAWQAARSPGSGAVEWGILGMLAFVAVAMLAGDLLYGLTGVVFWYLVGRAIGREQQAR
jgi:putative inorganic carbon (HCO3(-)) transporter